jgi:hypothetical protein
LVALPDITFQHSTLETVILIAYGERSKKGRRHSIFIDKKDYGEYIRTGQPTWQRDVTISFTGHETDPILWYNSLQHIWDECSYLSLLNSITDIHNGIEYKIPFRKNAAKLISDTPRPGYSPGLVKVKDGFEPYYIDAVKYLNVNPELMLYDAYKLPWERPKVLVNAVRLTRGSWTIAGSIDEQGLICYHNFHGIWPTNNVSIEVIAALLNSPFANAFISTHRASQHNLVGILRRIPIPNLTNSQTQSIISLVEKYRLYREQWLAQPERSDYFEQLCRELMWQIDAEVLAAYDLPPRLERELLDYFAGHQRPGPVKFDRYYPPDFRPSIPWRDYISEEFRSSTARRTLERLPVLHDPFISAMVEELD